MLQHHLFSLTNDLSVIVLPMPERAMALCSIMYDVGGGNENPEQTGIAHFYEHIRFGPSQNVPVYDLPLQQVGGTSNAYTSQDVTNYWCALPANQLEVAFWLESDRMLAPAYEEHTIEVQRNVVMEEFRQHHIVPPYGDAYHLLLQQAYTKHPYQWPVIGKTLDHIAECTQKDIVAFGDTFYHPSNAVLVVVGGVSPDNVYALAEKWFGNIPAKFYQPKNIPQEPWQSSPVTQHVQRNVPQNALYKSYHVPGRAHQDYISLELINGFFTEGISSRFRKHLVEKEMLFSEVDAYLTATQDPGLFVIEGKLQEGVSFTKADQALQALIDETANRGIPADALNKVKQQEKTKYLFSTTDMATKAESLAYASLISEVTFFDDEMARLPQITNKSIQATASHVFREENSHTLYYEKQ